MTISRGAINGIKVAIRLRRGPANMRQLMKATGMSIQGVRGLIRLAKGLVCIKEYRVEGSHIIPYYGLGSEDAPRPPRMSRAEASRRWRERQKEEKKREEQERKRRHELSRAATIEAINSDSYRFLYGAKRQD